ncbi:armadillo-type protein [Mycena polygramma]|nr:armadillo-type protein [Mycena polygramma]KAJ7636108.1 armadillo-type protein [Mycena polygramma]
MAQPLSLSPPSMPPLTRQESRGSIFSWWSDSNPALCGPTINLHAATKPLLKLMYHRQASEFIRKSRGSALSTDMMENYFSYLPWNFVSPATKVKILWDLSNRAASEADARTIVDSSVFEFLTAGMLDSPDPGVRASSCQLVGALVSHKCTAPAILDLKPCARLMSLLLDEDIAVFQDATFALCEISKWPDGAQAIIANANGLKHVSELLQSPSWTVRTWTCELVWRLANRESTASAILQLNLPKWVMSLEREPDVAHYWWPARILEDPRWSS